MSDYFTFAKTASIEALTELLCTSYDGAESCERINESTKPACERVKPLKVILEKIMRLLLASGIFEIYQKIDRWPLPPIYFVCLLYLLFISNKGPLFCRLFIPWRNT